MRLSPPMATFEGTLASTTGISPPGDVVEIGLLLPTTWANSLLEMSKRRGQSVSHILRGLVDRALDDDRATRL
jgi:hypothetical protein